MSKQDEIFSRLEGLELETTGQPMAEPVTIPEPAKPLNVSQGTVRNLIKQGRLDKITVGHKVYVHKSGIKSFARSEKESPFQEKSGQVKSSDRSVALSSGKALVEVSYLERLFSQLGQLKAEKQYLLGSQGEEKGTLELADAKARIVELQTKESEARSRAFILDKENKYIRTVLWIMVGVGLSIVIFTISLAIK